MSIAPISKCKNPDTYGQICVKCNKCGRFTYKFLCVNCHVEKESVFTKPKNWEYVEFYDQLRATICNKCVPLFKEEIVTDNYSYKVIPCKRADFKRRKAKNEQENIGTSIG